MLAAPVKVAGVDVVGLTATPVLDPAELDFVPVGYGPGTYTEDGTETPADADVG